VFLLLSGASALAVRPLQRFTLKKIGEIRDTVLGKAEAALGCAIQYDSIRPGLIYAFDIRGARVLGADSRALVSAARLRISYSLWDLIRGNSSAIHSVLIDRPHISIDMEQDRQILENLKNLADNGNAPEPANGAEILEQLREALAAYMPTQASLKIRGARCTVQAGGSQFVFNGGYVDIHAREKELSLSGRVTGTISAQQADSAPSAVPLAASLRANLNLRLKGEYSADTGEGSVHIALPFVVSDFFRLHPLEFTVALKNESLVVSAPAAGAPWNLSLEYGLESGNLSARYACNGMALSDIVAVGEPLKQIRSLLFLVSSGEASFDYFQGGAFQYSVAIDGSVPPSQGSGAFSFHGNGNREQARVSNFFFDAPVIERDPLPFRGKIGYRGSAGLLPFAPNGTLSFNDLTLSGNESVNGEFDIWTHNNVIGIFCQAIDLGTVSLAALDASVIPAERGIGFTLSALRFRNVESYSDVKLGTLSVDGAVDYEPARISASLRLDSFSAADIEGMLRPFMKDSAASPAVSNVLNGILLTTEIFFDTDFDQILYNAPLFVIASESTAAADVNQFVIPGINPVAIRSGVGLFSLSGTDRRFNLSEGRFVFNGNLISLNGYADYTNPHDINFSLMANYRDISYYLEGFFLDGRSLSIQGAHGVSVYIDSENDGSYSGFVQAENLPIAFRYGTGNLNLFASLRFNSAQLWSVNLDRLELLRPDNQAGQANFYMTGAGDQNGVHIPQIYYRDGRGSLEGSSVFSWQYQNTIKNNAENNAEDDTIENAIANTTANTSENINDAIADSASTELVLSGSLVMAGGSENYSASVEYAGKQLGVSVLVNGMQIGRFTDALGNATTDAEIKLIWNSIDSFRADLAISSLRARIQDNDLSLSAGGHITGNEMLISDLNIDFTDIKADISQFLIRLDDGQARTNAEIRGFAAGRPVDGSFSIDANFKSVESWLAFNDALNSFDGTFHITKLKYADLNELEPSSFAFSRSDGNITLSGGPRNMLRLNTARDGNFYASLSAPSPVRASVIGNITGNSIQAYSGDIYVDLEKLGQLLPPLPDLVLAGGYAAAELEIRGSLQDPEFFGLIRGTAVRLQVPHYVARDIRLVPFTALVDGNEIRWDPIPITVGSGAGILNGWFRFDRWVPGIFRLDIAVPPQTPIPFKFDITGFLAAGNTSGSIVLTLDGQTMNIGGNLYINDTEIGLNSDELISAQQNAGLQTDEEVAVVVDINVNTGPTVEFLWPSSSIPILRLNPDLGTSVKVTFDSLSQQFSLTSDIAIRSGEIYYFERSFYIRSGMLSLRENELRFDPLLTVRAEARDRNDEGPVIISMIVENAPLLSFTARFESRPSLSQTEIFALLGQSITGGSVDDSGNVQRVFLGSSADLIAQFVVVKQVERQIRRITRLDMFSFRTQLLQNAIFTATGLSPTPVDRIAGVGNYFDNTTVFFGKYIGADMFAQTMLALRYDEYKTTFGGLSFEWDIGIELQSPLFTIRWDFIPTHPENWWVSDNSITLTWSKTF